MTELCHKGKLLSADNKEMPQLTIDYQLSVSFDRIGLDSIT